MIFIKTFEKKTYSLLVWKKTCSQVLMPDLKTCQMVFCVQQHEISTHLRPGFEHFDLLFKSFGKSDDFDEKKDLFIACEENDPFDLF